MKTQKKSNAKYENRHMKEILAILFVDLKFHPDPFFLVIPFLVYQIKKPCTWKLEKLLK